MISDETDVDHAPWVLHDRHQPVFVAGDVEDDAITDEAGAAELLLELGRSRPIGFLGDGDPPLVASSKTGEAFTESGFRASFFKLLRRLEAAGTVKSGLTVHGLRHTAATMLADAGCSTREIMAVTGHRTEAMVALYTEGADRRRSADAAIARMERAGGRRRKR